jgi:hypothetical protein
MDIILNYWIFLPKKSVAFDSTYGLLPPKICFERWTVSLCPYPPLKRNLDILQTEVRNAGYNRPRASIQ